MGESNSFLWDVYTTAIKQLQRSHHYEAAESLLCRSIEHAQRLHAMPTSLNAAATDLANCFCNQQGYRHAENILKRLLVCKKKIGGLSGADIPELQQLARLLRRRNKVMEAAAIEFEITIIESVLGMHTGS